MRLLNVDSFTFTEFNPADIPKYAIASHRWKPNAEVMLKDVQEGNNKLSDGYQKVQGFARYIQEHIMGIKWLWMDTCCLDQTDSQEISGAINSMFRWYRDAEVCLAYLHDVPTTGDLSSFKRSAWFTRGWTLQELLAPELVVFLDKEWEVIGHKGKSGFGRSGVSIETGIFLEKHIAAITAIPEAVLRNYERSHALTVEDKLRWMGNRQTTREEDYWYCLLGILGISMHIRYGDGQTKERIFNKLPQSSTALYSRENEHMLSSSALLSPMLREAPSFIEWPWVQSTLTCQDQRISKH